MPSEDEQIHARYLARRARERSRDALDYAIGFIAGSVLIGLPVAIVFGCSTPIRILIVLVAGIAGAMRGDAFLHWMADSWLWSVIRSLFWPLR